MDYKSISSTSGIHSLEDHLLAIRAGYKSDGCGDSIYENVNVLRYGRNRDAQLLVDRLLSEVGNESINDTDMIDHLLSIARADKIINNTPNTFSEL